MKAHSFDQNLHIEFCVILSSAYIELNRDPEKARDMLEELLAELKAETVHPHLEAKINLGLGKAYRYPEGMSVIMQYFSYQSYYLLYSIATVVIYTTIAIPFKLLQTHNYSSH